MSCPPALHPTAQLCDSWTGLCMSSGSGVEPLNTFPGASFPPPKVMAVFLKNTSPPSQKNSVMNLKIPVRVIV